MCVSPYGWHQGSLENRAPNSAEYADSRAAINYLIPGMAMWQCPWISTLDHTARLDLQSDGNLVLYYFPSSLEVDGTNPPVVLWATSTSSGAMLIMWPSGNLTLYDAGWNQLWTAPLASGINSPIAGSIATIKWVNGLPALEVIAPDGTVNWSTR